LAYEYLLKAENKGWQSIDLSSALGLVLALKWKIVKGHSLSISDKIKKQEYLNKQKQLVYLPAIKYLEEAQKGLSTSNFISSYLAYLEDDVDKAIEYIEKENTINSWHYEAFAFASILYINKSIPILNSHGYQQVEDYIKLSELKMSQAIDIGRSDPDNYKENCSNFGFKIQLQLDYRIDSFEDTFEQGLATCQKALQLAPSPKAAGIFINLKHLYANNAFYQTRQGLASLDYQKKAHEIVNQGLKIHPNNKGLLTASVDPLIALAEDDIENNQKTDHYYQLALTNLKKSLSIDPSQRKSWYQLAKLHKNMGNYHRSKNNHQKANQHYQQSITNYEKVIQLGNKLSGLANIALVLEEQAKLKLLANKPQEAIRLLKKAVATSEEIIQFNKDIFAIFTNYYEYQYELVNALKTNNMPFTIELHQAIESINDGCNLDYLKDSQLKMVETSINFFVDNDYATAQDFDICQTKMEELKKINL
jgi:tetratricopeptide (TPR) repeat protein